MQFQQCRRKVYRFFFFTLPTLHLCTLQIFTITDMDPEHDRNRPEKSKALHRIEVLLSTFPLAPSKQCWSGHAQMSNWDYQHCVVGARGSDYELQLNIFYLAINMLVNGSGKHILLSNSNSNTSYLTMYKLLTRQISFRTKKPKKGQKQTLFKEVVLCV